MILSMEVFTFAAAKDLNMGYYHIKLDSNDQKLCTIVFPWGMVKVQIQTLIFPEVFQNVMSKLVQVMEYANTKLLS
jgi:hypothetical protein